MPRKRLKPPLLRPILSMLEVYRKHGMSLVKLSAGEKLPRDSRVCQAQPGEWFALIERPVVPGSCTRYGIARIRKSGAFDIQWYKGSGVPNVRALYVFAALENEKSFNWE